ncbi:MAG: hypothetical protein IJ031_02430 [Oscillospiraceae bacterium]|nr:hypothetical protein [Oscillospiraceae bacterium]MBQ8378569.1 hypothetical protein [Oscillospiraceae bacterium]MBQ8883438.1 hypothetical protein [Oscillospiraceae bacterium]
MKENAENKGFYTIMGALILVVASTAFFVYKLMSNKAYYERWKDYDECGIG